MLLLSLLAALITALLWLGVAAGPVYTVPTLNAHLARDPDAWLGRTVQVRGIVENCPQALQQACEGWQPGIVDLATVITATPLLLVGSDSDPLSELLPRLPLLQALLPAPQAVRWGAVATYRVQLRALATNRHSTTEYEAQLLEAMP